MKSRIIIFVLIIFVIFLYSCSIFCSEEDKCADDVQPRIAFLRITNNYDVVWDPNLWIMDRNGNNETQLTFDLNVYYFNFSPNGKKICFRGEVDDIPNIYMINSDGSDLIKLTDDSNNYFSPLFIFPLR